MKRPLLFALLSCLVLPLSAQTAVSLFWRADSLQVPEIVSEQAVQYKYVGHHGPAVENTHCALRIYFNDSGAIDVYSKSGKQMELRKYLWYPSAEQQDREEAGCDEYLVGKTVGLGGIALWDGEKEVKLAATRGRTARVGKMRDGAYAEMIAYGVLYRGSPVDISIRVEMKDNSRTAQVIASELNGRKVQFLTGVNYHPGETVEYGRNYISVWGVHPADVSQHPSALGGGMWFQPRHFLAPEKTKDMVRIVSKPASRIETSVVAASVKEADLNTADKFAAYMRKSETKLDTVIPGSKKEDKDHIMSDAYWIIWNPQVQARIDADIDANRKADAILRLNLPAGTKVSIEQVSHDFIFGAQIFNFNQLGTHERNERYKSLFGTLFNRATIPFYWKSFETEPGRLRFATEYWDTEEFWNNCEHPESQPHWRRPSTDQLVDFCESKGIQVHGHPMVWGCRISQHPHWILEKMLTPEEHEIMDGYLVDWEEPKTRNQHYTALYDSLSAERISESLPEYTQTINTLIEDRIRKLAAHYGDRIQSWDVVNESAADFKFMKSRSGLIKGSRYGLMPADYPFKAFQLAQSALPSQTLLNINDYQLKESYVKLVRQLTERGCRIDVMGCQMHLFDPEQCLKIAEGEDIQTPERIWRWTALIGQAGKALHMSELTIPAPGNDPRSRLLQAIIIRNLYRIWFSIKPMMGITWWNIVDDCDFVSGGPPTSGLFDRDMNPKPSYYALDQLINHEWKTNLTVMAGKKDEIRFRGFKGHYRVSWKDRRGRVQTREFDLKKDGDGLTF